MQENLTIVKAVADIVAVTVAGEYGVPCSRVFRGTRGGRAIVLARQTTIYLLHVVFGYSAAHIAIAIARDRSTIRHACRVIEDTRDDPVFDEILTTLEKKIAFLANAQRIGKH